MSATKLLLIVFTVCVTLTAQTSRSLKQIQSPFASLKPSAILKIGGDADWVLVTNDAVWVGSSKPNSVHRIDPATNRETAQIMLPGEPCSGLVFAFGSIWVPLCGDPHGSKPSLARIDSVSNKITHVLPLGPAGPEGGITASNDSIWIVIDEHGTLARINPATNTVRQSISITPGSYNPLFSHGIIWITGFETNTLTPINANSGEVLASIPVGPKPRFLTSGAASIWTLNQGDGTLTRVNAHTRKVVATIPLDTPGHGGDICYGAGSVWTSVFHVPLTRIAPATNHVIHQWIGSSGDSLRFGFGSVWLTDYRRGLLLRIPYQATLLPR
jgi:streptogramin lyase